MIPNLPVRTRLFIKRTPWLYRPAKHLADRHAKGKLCDATTDLCIEGYQSSGNSFSFGILRHASSKLRIAHHCHSVANLRLALDYGVPTVCLIRDPKSAIPRARSRRDWLDLGATSRTRCSSMWTFTDSCSNTSTA